MRCSDWSSYVCSSDLTICGAEFLVMENRYKAFFLYAVLRPNPPMNPRALLIILIIVALINFIFGLSFVLHGAWPIMPFLGADVGLLASSEERRVGRVWFS